MLSTVGDVFAGFGKSKFSGRSKAGEIELAASYGDVRRQLRESCPNAPGVYGMVDCGGRLVYVGMSRCLRKRTLTYFQERKSESLRGPQARKEARVASRAKRLVWENTGHELLAWLREHELIRRFAPEMNVRDRRGRSMAYVYLSDEDAPRFKVGAQLPSWCRHFWGPVARTRQLRRATETLNRYFRLPDCSPDVAMRFRDERLLFELELYPRCLRGEVNQCVAPCAGWVSSDEYFAQVGQGRAFLDGENDAPLAEIDRGIAKAASERRFERAASLRDLRLELVELRDRLSRRADLLPTSFVYALERGRRPCWLAVHEGEVAKVAPAPRNERVATIWQTRLAGWTSPVAALNTDREARELQIVGSWFRQSPGELERVMEFDAARDVCNQWAGKKRESRQPR